MGNDVPSSTGNNGTSGVGETVDIAGSSYDELIATVVAANETAMEMKANFTVETKASQVTDQLAANFR